MRGESGTAQLLILSQVILSLQLSFAVFPLVMFTSDKLKMGEFVNPLAEDIGVVGGNPDRFVECVAAGTDVYGVVGVERSFQFLVSSFKMQYSSYPD